ncbi:MAG: hypothetical protein J0I41_00500 [Filimonas sp.]|nr:hypothetical protein [Filimonas sp.]
MRRKLIIIFLVLACIFKTGLVMAGVEPYQNILRNIKKGDSLVVQDEKFRNSAYQWSAIQNHIVKNIISLNISYDTAMVIKKDFTCEVFFKVEYYSQPGQAQPAKIENQKLKVNYAQHAGGISHFLDSYGFSNGHWVKVTIDSITAPELHDSIPAVVQLKSQIIIERQYDIPADKKLLFQGALSQTSGEIITPQGANGKVQAKGIMALQAINPPPSPDRHLSLTWASIAGMEEYDLEWTTVEDNSIYNATVQSMMNNTSGLDPALVATIFKNNATRVTTHDNNYDISLVYSSKYILVRMRGVKYTTDGLRDEREWDYQLTNGQWAIWQIDAKWHEPNLNWQFSASFAEEGKKKEVISYFDGSLRNRQSVTINNSDNVGVVQENVLDEFGRAAVAILPAPVKDNNFHYFKNFNLNNSGAKYNYTNLGSSNNCGPIPDPLNSSAATPGAAQYYSANNEFLATSNMSRFIAKAEGYPMTVTQYTADNTGRIKMQGGVGKTFQPGINPTDHTTKYYYGKPEQWELDRIFGNDAGDASHYLKNMVVDANNQVSISYVNSSGKTIATALTAATPAGMNTLPSQGTKKTEVIEVLSADRFVFDPTNLNLAATTTYLASIPGPATLQYDIKKLIAQYNKPGFTICSNCYYDLIVKVYNDCNIPVYTTSQPVQVGARQADCNAGGVATNTIALNFPSIGEYYIGLELRLSRDVIEDYTNEYVRIRQQNGDMRTEIDFVTDYLNNTSFSNCFNDCKTCSVALGERADFIQVVRSKLDENTVSYTPASMDTWAGGLYDALKAQCNALQQTCDMAPCDRYRKLMLEDVSPKGQYALFDANGDPLEKPINVLFQHFRDVFPVEAAGGTNYNNELITLDEYGTTTSPYDANFTLQQLVAFWKDEWANKFLQYHPEYCKLQFCQANSSYYGWDLKVQTFVTTASQIGSMPNAPANLQYDYNNAAWMLAADPFFAPGAPGYSKRSDMQADLLHYTTRVMNMPTTVAEKSATAYIDYSLYCADKSGTTNSQSTTDNWTNCTPVSSCRVPDREWNDYSDLYFELKEKYYTQLRNATTCANACTVSTPVSYNPNGCATVNDFVLSEATASEGTGTTCGTGTKKIKLAYLKNFLANPTTITLYYPAEYSGQPSTFSFTAGQQETYFCVPATLPLSTVHIKTITCTTGPVMNDCPGGGSAGSVTLQSDAYDLNDKQVLENDYINGVKRIYSFVSGDAVTPPADAPYCTTGTVTSKQFYNCYKVYRNGVSVPQRYYNVWVIVCEQSLCGAGSPEYNMEMQMGAYKFYANGNYYYINSSAGGMAAECSNPSVTPVQPCIKVKVNNGNPLYFYNAQVSVCNTCATGNTNSIIATTQLGTNQYQAADGTKFEIFPNTLQGDPTYSNICPGSPKVWFACFQVQYNGNTITYSNASVHSCVDGPTCSGPTTLVYFDHQNGTRSFYSIISGQTVTGVVSDTYPEIGVNCQANYYECLAVGTSDNGTPIRFYNVWLTTCGGFVPGGGGPQSPQMMMTANMEAKAIPDPSAPYNNMMSMKAADETVMGDYTDNSIYLVKSANAAQISKWQKTGKDTLRATNPFFHTFRFKKYFVIHQGKGIAVQLKNVWVAKMRPVYKHRNKTTAKTVNASKANKTTGVASKQMVTTIAAESAVLYDFAPFGEGDPLPPVSVPTCGASDFTITPSPVNNCPTGKTTYIVSNIANTPLCVGQFADVNIILSNVDGSFIETQVTFTGGEMSKEVCVTTASLNVYPVVTACGTIQGTCTGGGGGGTQGCSPAYQYKTPRFIETANVSGGAASQADINAIDNENVAGLNNQLKTACESQADEWMLRLANGLTAYTDAQKLTLKNALIDICSKGGDIEHLFGSSTTAPGKVAVNGYTSFAQAMKGLTGGADFTENYNPWLLDMPYPYQPKAQLYENVVSKANADICNRLAQLQQDYTTAGYSGTFYQYLKNRFGAAMVLTTDEFATLQQGCTNCKFILAKDLSIPVFMDPGAKGCVGKQEFETAMADMTAAFGSNGLSATHDNYETIVRNYLNHRWGFSLGYADYLTYQSSIVSDPNALLCNQPIGASIPTDPYACMKSLVTTAIINGRKDYEAYLEEEKRLFRNTYINACKDPAPSVHLTAEQQIYHYTLYYYDQASNLVRTVPPEGVTFLSDKEMEWVRNARKTSAQNCSYTGPQQNTDKTTTLNALSGTLGATTATSLEYWQYNENGGGGQVLTGTPDKHFMYHSCLSGNYLNIEVFSMEQHSTDEIEIIRSNQVTVDVSALLPLHPWTHIVVQPKVSSGTLASSDLDVYVNGTLMPQVAGAPPAGCGWEISGDAPVQLPENLAYLKYIRLYNRSLTAVEIAANAAESCFGLAPAYAAALNGSLQHWGRFNTPATGSNTLLADNSTTETKNVPVYPWHSLMTSYAYNSINQVSKQFSPDGGTSKFWYDMLGRLAFSQNAKQATQTTYGYTRYDEFGRIKEAGELAGNTGLQDPGYLDAAGVDNIYNSTTKYQITATFYDAIPAGVPGLQNTLTQENLRKRVAISAYRDNMTVPYARASYYDYDLLGNVKTLYQQVSASMLKKIAYEYDLVSGKVNYVRYQHGQNDQFYYGYKYDAENRLTNALTSIDAVLTPQGGTVMINPQSDATYAYYLHGPLGRMELGKDKVQGVDYAYTLQGWIKGVNSTAASEVYDMGKDGQTVGVARDAYGYGVHYYTGDYEPIDNSVPPFAQAGTLQDLYNGNIAAMSVNIKALNQPLLYKYRYDQLNRLGGMTAHTGLNISNNTWNPVAIEDFKETITYDDNGNISTYVRNGNSAAGKPLAMDNMTYAYNKDDRGRLTNNRLRHIKDAVPLNNYSEDIDEQGDDNYSYDAIGNLISDNQEGITKIDWTVYGKINSIFKNGNLTTPAIQYSYDVGGNRVAKFANGKTTYYIRDAQGTSLAVYEQDGAGNLVWKEQALYGSSRLGMWTPDISVNEAGSSYWNIAGKKSYELTNHLGNVLAVINDVKAYDGTRYDATVINASDYAPFGMQMIGRNFNTGVYRYGFNGQEMSNEIKDVGNSYTAQFWEYDPRIGRRWNLDPKPTTGISEYSAFYNSPIWFNDRLGDSSVINNRGYMLHYDAKDKDLRVFMKDGDKLSLIGELGKEINANGWLKNLLWDNATESRAIVLPTTFQKYVKQDGKWDYKYRSPANQDANTKKLPYHILGIAFQRKDKDKARGIGDLGETLFSFDGFDGKKARAEDVNNFHFGVVGKANLWFTEGFMLKQAGAAEMGKWADDYKLGKRPTPEVPASWRPVIGIHYDVGARERAGNSTPELGPPYGDNPIDHWWIKRGFGYYSTGK